MEFTTQELAPLAEQMAAICVKKVEQAEQDRNIMELEEGIRQGLKQLGKMVLGRTLSQAEGSLEKKLASECGGELRYQRKREAKLKSLFDWVEYERSYYGGCSCGQGRAPLDEEYGLEPGEVTPGLGRLLALAGSGLPFGESALWVKEFLLLELSENSIRKESQAFGQFQVEVEAKLKAQSQAADYLQKRLRAATERQPSGLSGCMALWMAPMCASKTRTKRKNGEK